jgi:hypothetical protein
MRDKNKKIASSFDNKGQPYFYLLKYDPAGGGSRESGCPREQGGTRMLS